MDTKILEYIVAIADNESISKAAEQLYLSQPLLSRHLKNAEKELGVSLFSRVHNRMELTQSGRIFINSVRSILYTEKRLAQDLEDLREGRRGKIRLVVDPYLLPLFERMGLAEFRRACPSCEIIWDAGTASIALAALNNDLTDMILLKGNDLPKDATVSVLFSEEMVLVCPKCVVPGPELNRERMQELLDEYPLLMEQTDEVMRQTESRILQLFKLKPSTTLEVRGSAALIEMVKKGKGIALLPKALAQAHSEWVNSQEFRPSQPFYIYLAYGIHHLPTAREACFLETMKKTYRNFDTYLKQIAQTNYNHTLYEL